MRPAPWTLGGQPTRNNAYPRFLRSSILQDCLIVLAEPGSDLFTYPAWEALSQISTSTPLPSVWTCTHSHKRQVDGDLTDRTSRNKAQTHATTGGLEHPITGECFRVRISFVLDQFV